jgi:HK97 family phage prohead protease
MQIRQRDFGFQVKAVKDDGTFEGYGSVFGVVDSYNEVVAPGAFAGSLDEHKAKGRMPALLWQHRMSEPIGVYTQMAEDKTGLYVQGRLVLESARGAEAYALLKAGALSGLSIGYMERKVEEDKTTGIRTLTDLDLWEVSLVTFPANDEARVSDVKTALRRGLPIDIRSFEAELREVFGLSQSQVKGLLACGFKGMGQREVDECPEESVKAAITSLRRLSNHG